MRHPGNTTHRRQAVITKDERVAIVVMMFSLEKVFLYETFMEHKGQEVAKAALPTEISQSDAGVT